MNLLTLLAKIVFLPFQLAGKLAVFLWDNDEPWDEDEVEEPPLTYHSCYGLKYGYNGEVIGHTDGFHDS